MRIHIEKIESFKSFVKSLSQLISRCEKDFKVMLIFLFYFMPSEVLKPNLFQDH